MADPTGIEAAGKVANVGSNAPKTTRDDHDKMATMRSRLTMAQAAYSDSREDELDDLRFMAGSPDKHRTRGYSPAGISTSWMGS